MASDFHLTLVLNVLLPLTRVGSRLARFHPQFLRSCGANSQRKRLVLHYLQLAGKPTTWQARACTGSVSRRTRPSLSSSAAVQSVSNARLSTGLPTAWVCSGVSNTEVIACVFALSLRIMLSPPWPIHVLYYLWNGVVIVVAVASPPSP